MQIIRNSGNRYFCMIIADNEHLHSVKELRNFYLANNITYQSDILSQEYNALLASHKLFFCD